MNAGQLNISGGPSSIQNSSMTGTGSVNISSFGGIAIVSSTVGSGQTFNFLDGDRDQLILNPTTFGATVSGFQSGNQIHSFTAIDGEVYNPANHVLSLTNGGQPVGSLIIAGPLSYTTQSFFISNNTITTDVPCFCRGTRILTRQGEVEVEDLTVGDEVMTASGVLRPVVFTGRTRDRELQPILIRRGALGDDIPHRDLYVSPGHALFLSEVLVRAESLVNGHSIVQCDAVEEVEYYHVELPEHDVLFAEGAAAESLSR